MKPKSINSLMAYMRNEKGLEIKGSTQKRKLRYMGYFHGYKGYRYCGSPYSLIPFNDFNELQSVYDFDMTLKSLLYGRIMTLETTIKNYVLESVLIESKTEKFAEIFSNLLTSYKEYTVGSDPYQKAMKKRLSLREHVYKAISRDYKKPLVNHYYDKDEPVPIWAIFELLSMGELGNFIACLNEKTRIRISKEMGIKHSVDSTGKMPVMIVYALTDLRNAVAHNGTVFDTRFKTGEISNKLSQYIESETGIKNVSFNSIVDYIILLVFLMKGLKYSKIEIGAFISQYEEACETLYKQIPINIYSRIIYTDNRSKINALRAYCKK